MIPCVFVAGPTAAGKTEYAVRLAEDLDGEIVSADSMQIYKYMDIGSAKPSPEERKRAVHHLVDLVDPRESFSAADYKKEAMDAVLDISRRNKLPIICGGTGLYINALLYDMDFSAPEGSEENRSRIFHECGNDPNILYEKLKSLDPKAASQIHPNNVKRVLRAVERLLGGEKELSSFSSLTRKNPLLSPVLVGIERDRDELYRRIDRRVDVLMQMGLVDEVRSLMEMGLTSSDIAMKGIGYKEIIDSLNAGGSGADASGQICLNTRHYAKRQLTWFRRYEDMRWFVFCENEDDGAVYEEMLSYVKGQLTEKTDG